jgi:hypothetical protein
LKAQIQPHFLFNTLNSIYALALRKDDRTAQTVVKLAEFMRYIIRDAQHDQVAVEKEMAYIIPWLILLSRTPIYGGFRITGAVFAGMAALVWITERVLEKANPLTALVERIAHYAPWLLARLAIASLLSVSWQRSKNRTSPLP